MTCDSRGQRARGAWRTWSRLVWGLWLAFTQVVLIHPTAWGQLPPAESLRTLTPPDGFEIKTFASEPMIVNPIAIDVDTYGRVWVTEGVNYRRNVNNPPDNKIKVLEDTDGDGVADKVTVFTSDLNAAMGVCVAGGKIYVPESPHLYVYEDANNDLKPDGPRKTLLTGFGGKNHDHGVHGQIFGPDHRLYMTNGDTGFDVTGPDGSHIAFRWGAMIRCEADGSKLEAFAVNFRNPVELSVDSFGNVWCSDNDNDGLKSVRICWILEGGNYGWFGGPENIRNPDGSFDPIHHWRADKPGFVPYTLITGFGSPCGMTCYEGDAFGAKFKGNFLHCDAGPREVRLYTPVRAQGVGYKALMENIVTGTDKYFRPVDPVVAPDGSLFITDWYDGGVGGHAYNDPTRGRIYRVVPKGKKLTRKEKPGPYTNTADALLALRSPNLATTYLAREHLLAQGEKFVPELTTACKLEQDEIVRARLLWLLGRLGGTGLTPVKEELESRSAKFRALAVRILRRETGAKFEDDLQKLLSDSDGEVQKEVLLASRSFRPELREKLVLAAAARYDGEDRYLLETLHVVSKGIEQPVMQALTQQAGNRVDQRLIDLVRILRPDDAAKFLGEKLATPGLADASQQAILKALAAMNTLDAGRSLLGVVSASATNRETKRLVLDAVRQQIGGAWSGLKTDAALKKAVADALQDEALAPAALALIGQGGLTQFSGDVSKLLADTKVAEPTRKGAIDVATRISLDAGAALAGIVTGTSGSNDLKETALKALVATGEMRRLADLLADAKQLPAVRERVNAAIMASTEGPVYVLRLIDDKKLEQTYADAAIKQAVEHPDVNVRLLFEKFIPVEKRPKTLGQSLKADDILKLAGDTARGEKIYLQSGTASCIKCHRIKGKGADIGPDLSQIGRKYEKAALLQTILNPSAGIAPEYTPYVVETKSGKAIAGFLHEQTAERITLKTTQGVLLGFAKNDVEELVKLEKSLMPELLLSNVTAQDAADLLAYLASLQETMVHASQFRILGGFPNVRPEQRTEDFGVEKNAGAIDFAKKVEGPGGMPMGWSTVSLEPVNGIPQLSVKKLKGRTENVIYYFAIAVDSTTAQAATLHIGSDDGIQVWHNGKKVHDKKISRALNPGDDKVPVSLTAGKNLLLLKLDQGQGDGGISLSVEARQNFTLSLP